MSMFNDDGTPSQKISDDHRMTHLIWLEKPGGHDSFFTCVAGVPSGWIVRTESQSGVAMVFVPKPKDPVIE